MACQRAFPKLTEISADHLSAAQIAPDGGIGEPQPIAGPVTSTLNGRVERSDLTGSNPVQGTADAYVMVRDGTQEDWQLLHSAFLHIYGRGETSTKDGALSSFGSKARRTPHGIATPVHVLRAKLDMLLHSPDWKLLVACPNFQPNEVIGMVLYRHKLRNPLRREVGWLTVKPKWQRKRVASELLRVAGLTPCIDNQIQTIDCAFWLPEICEVLAPKFGYRLRFRPYLPDVALYSMIEAQQQKGEVVE